MAMSMGCRVAEELVFGYGEVSSGAAGDIQQSTSLARKMVTLWGMSEKLGPVQYAANEQEIFLGHSVAQQQNVSEETSRLIDAEIKRLVEDGYERAKKILTDHRDQLNLIGEALLEYETLTGEELKELLEGKEINRKNPPSSGKKKPKASAGSVPTTEGKDDKKTGKGFGPETQPEG